MSWIRHRDLHILSVGSQTYTSDDRFEAVPQAAKGDWMLRIKYALPRDSGQYDCQVSSTPPTARTVHLTVIGKAGALLLTSTDSSSISIVFRAIFVTQVTMLSQDF